MIRIARSSIKTYNKETDKISAMLEILPELKPLVSEL